ncbi:YhbY family RNA-binding protein [Candidatus Bathyarchaeota archaeon]|nr:YhbY family RNA-binding protein [Candidatus Bathyarchaeota archaeon]
MPLLTTKRVLRRIKREFSSDKPNLWIGKNGVSSDIIEELIDIWRNREVTKVLLHRIVPQSTEDIACVLAKKTGSLEGDMRGRSFVLCKPQKRDWEAKQNSASHKS